MDLTPLIESAERELARLDQRRSELLSQIAELKRARIDFCNKPSLSALDESNFLFEKPTDKLLDTHLPTESKIALFRSLFRGREDVFPRRFESIKSGRNG